MKRSHPSGSQKKKKHIQDQLYEESLPKVKDFFFKISEITTSTTSTTEEDRLEDKAKALGSSVYNSLATVGYMQAIYSSIMQVGVGYLAISLLRCQKMSIAQGPQVLLRLPCFRPPFIWSCLPPGCVIKFNFLSCTPLPSLFL